MTAPEQMLPRADDAVIERMADDGFVVGCCNPNAKEIREIVEEYLRLTRPATDELVEALEAMKKALEAIVCFDRIEPKGSHCDFEDSVPANDGRFAQIARTALRNTGAVS